VALTFSEPTANHMVSFFVQKLIFNLVVDVNGFSFVKTSTKYYEDTAKILGNTILRRLATSLKIPWHIPFQAGTVGIYNCFK
jgi:inositol hexakisphosphate/diphosphoinositol-pentakisphosphate kinase